MMMIDLLDHFADALVAISPDGTVVFWNLGAEAMFGYPRGEAVGRALIDLIVPPDRRDEDARRLAAVLETDTTTFEATRQRDDGAIVYVDVSMRAVRDDAGAVRHVAISMKDVSQLKYLREATMMETRFRGLLEAAPDAMVLVNADGRIVLANTEAERLFGYDRTELLGSSIDRLVPERLRGHHPAHRATYAHDPRTRPMGSGLDLLARRKDGSEFAAEISLSPVLLPEGMFTSAAIRNVAVRRKIEAKFRGLLEAAPDAIVIVDRLGRIAIINAQAERLFGYHRSELIGQPVEMLVPPRDREPHLGHRASYFADPRARAMGTGRELHAVHKDGTEIPVEISLSPLETEDGILVSTAIRDVTQRKDTEAALRLAYKELESFSYSIAHDLRAPLRGMNGFAQILLEDFGSQLPAEAIGHLHEIRDNAIKMGGLIDALLALSRVSRSELHREQVDLGSLARTFRARQAAVEPGRTVELVTTGRLVASADPTLARTLVANLLDNAWKFTRRTAAPRVELGETEDAGTRTFYVRDNGAGFDMASVERLFNAFQRLHPEREFPGTGIGLATAQRIVHRHGGRIWAEGTVGGGATFRFTLPDNRDGASP